MTIETGTKKDSGDIIRPVQNRFTALWGSFKADDMTRHGLLMVTFVTLGSFFNYVYQLVMGIMLTPEKYGILFSLTSLLVILQVFSHTIIMAMAKFTSKLKAQDNLRGVYALWRFSLKRNFILGVAAFGLLAAMSPLVAYYLRLDSVWHPVVLFTSIFFLLLISVNWGVLQGLQRFLPFGLGQAATYLVRLMLGALFVYAGWGILGGLVAIPVSLALVLPFTFSSLRDLPKSGEASVVTDSLLSYTGLTMLAMVAIAVLTNFDVILARHYLPATEAGNYATISVLGRAAFYAPLGAGFTMFPKTSEFYESGGNYQKLFRKALLMTGLIAGFVVLVYWLFPSQITQLLFGEKYPLVAANLLKYSGAMGMLAIAFLLVNYFLSLNRTRIAYALLSVAALQIILIAVFHGVISQFINIMLLCGALSVVVMVPFYMMLKR